MVLLTFPRLLFAGLLIGIEVVVKVVLMVFEEMKAWDCAMGSIVDFYPSISELLLDDAINWGKQFTTISDSDIK